MIRFVSWIILVVVAIVVVAFAVSNRQPMTLDLWPLPFLLNPPVYLVVLAAVVFGFALGGAVSWWSAVWRTRRKVRKVRERHEQEKEAERAARAEAAADSALPQADRTALSDGRNAA